MTRNTKAKRPPFEIAGTVVPAGTRATVGIPLSVLSDHTPMTLPVQVIHGRREGPVGFVSAAVHGDEIIGVEIIRRLARVAALRRLSGTLLLVPIVNTFGFISHSRYLPDRRDLNRSFPGSETGSLASQLAHRFLNDVVARCDFGIDLHSAAVNRENLPQIRVNPDDARSMDLAKVFGAPVIIKSPLRDGSLRSAAHKREVPVLVYEAGEGLRFDEFSIRVGVKGVLRVLQYSGMTASRSIKAAAIESPVARKSSWMRAPAGGILRALRKSGDTVKKGEVLGIISDPFGEEETEVAAATGGLVIGRTNLPVVNQGDALFHVAILPAPKAAGEAIDVVEQDVGNDPIFDEDEIL
ncbi:MAG: succinylglutamate desuccinylase/aspartoacylase family protein [Alphaproteobacteria bacterium]|nr:succinylglutamate desuccinylase/aspartoacylase family protein [Alphaproteobacteria bacterium]